MVTPSRRQRKRNGNNFNKQYLMFLIPKPKMHFFGFGMYEISLIFMKVICKKFSSFSYFVSSKDASIYNIKDFFYFQTFLKTNSDCGMRFLSEISVLCNSFGKSSIAPP